MQLNAKFYKDLAKPALIYGGLLAGGTFLLTLIEYHTVVRRFSTELYIVLIALFFTGLGIWAGRRLTPTGPIQPFTRNAAALKSLGITNREFEVLERLAEGQSNKQMARTLGVSPNTIKTQIASLFTKIEATRRTEAVRKARELSLIP